LAYLGENHGGDLLGREGLLLAEVLDLDLGGTVVIDDLEGPRLDVLLDGRVVEATANQTPEGKFQSEGVFRGDRTRAKNSLGIEDSVAGVHGSVVLGGLTDQTLLLGEGNERRGGERTLLVGDDLDIGTLVRSNAGVGGTCEGSLLASIFEDFCVFAVFVEPVCDFCPLMPKEGIASAQITTTTSQQQQQQQQQQQY
jgi:hypothetical protein